MIFRCKEKFQLQTTKCNADQSRPDCSLIEELREIQKEERDLRLQDILPERRRAIMDLLYKSTRVYGALGSCYDYSGMFYEIESKGCNYTNIEGLEKTISLLQEYKELTEKQLECDQRISDLQQRQKEIKNMLGIN